MLLEVGDLVVFICGVVYDFFIVFVGEVIVVCLGVIVVLV